MLGRCTVTSIAAWEIGRDDEPRRIPADRDFLEKHLEEWIERDPSLLAGDVHWAARQLTLPDRSRLDLLGLSIDGTWVIAELKPGPPEGGAVNQALHYFTQIASMTNGELAERIRVLTSHGFDVPIRVVTFQVLRGADGRRILLREIEDAPEGGEGRGVSRSSLDDVLVLAERGGVRPGFAAIRRHLLGRGYREHRRGTGLNFNTGSRFQCLWVRPAEGTIHLAYLGSNFPMLFGVDERQAEADLGENSIDLAPDEALARVTRWADVIDDYRGAEAPELEQDGS
jgi:hypothetical protein